MSRKRLTLFRRCVTERASELWTLYGASGHEYQRKNGNKARNTKKTHGAIILLFVMTPSMMNILSGIVLSLISVNHFNVLSSRVFGCAGNMNIVNVSYFTRKSYAQQKERTSVSNSGILVNNICLISISNSVSDGGTNKSVLNIERP